MSAILECPGRAARRRPVVFLFRALASWVVASAALAVPCLHSAEESFKSLLDLGVRHYQAREYFQAMGSFEAALAKAPAGSTAEIRGWLARATGMLGAEFFNEGEFGRAEETFRQAIECADDFYARFGLGYLHFVRLEDESARQELERALALTRPRQQHGVREQDVALARKVLAMTFYRKGDTERGLEELDRALESRPNDVEAKSLRDRWRTERSHAESFQEETVGRFQVRWDSVLGEATRSAVREELKLAADDMGRQLGLWTRGVVVTIFSASTFHSATGAFHWVGGLYDGQIKIPVANDGLLSRAARGAARATIRHEYVHALIREALPACPVWLHEGLAQYFEGKHTAEQVARELLTISASRIPMSQVPDRLWGASDRDLARRVYLQGLSFVDYLSRKFGEFRLRLLLAAIRQERSVARGVKRVYARELEELERAWWQDVENLERPGSSNVESK